MIDICIVTYNSLNWFRIFVDYLFKNTKDFRLFVSDSGSTDGTCKYLSKLKKQYPNIINFRHTQDNSGWTKGINWAVSQGSGEYVLIANADIILPQNWFERMSAHFTEGVGAVGPISDVVSGRQAVVYSYGQYEDEVDLLIGFCSLTKREILDKVGCLDEHYLYSHDDYDFSIRLKKAGYQLIIARDVFVKHFSYPGLMNLESASPELFKDAEEYTIAKHGQEIFKRTKEIKPSVVVAIPYYGDVDPDFVSSMLSLKQPGGAGSTVFARTERTLIGAARNLLAQAAIDYRSQFLLFIDSDMVFGSQSLMRLLTRACDPSISIIGGLAHKRREPFEASFARKVKNKWRHCQVPDVPGVYEVDAIGMGFTLIKTKVFESLKKPYFYLDKKGMCEDFNFCLAAKKAGHRIFVDTTVQIGHLGERILVDYHFVKTNLVKEN